jgi:hypothetical protein
LLPQCGCCHLFESPRGPNLPDLQVNLDFWTDTTSEEYERILEMTTRVAKENLDKVEQALAVSAFTDWFPGGVFANSLLSVNAEGNLTRRPDT